MANTHLSFTAVFSMFCGHRTTFLMGKDTLKVYGEINNYFLACGKNPTIKQNYYDNLRKSYLKHNIPLDYPESLYQVQIIFHVVQLFFLESVFMTMNPSLKLAVQRYRLQ